MEVHYGYKTVRPELACVIERGKISAYGWFLIIGGWLIKTSIVIAILVGLMSGYLSFKSFLIFFVIGLLAVGRR